MKTFLLSLLLAVAAIGVTDALIPTASACVTNPDCCHGINVAGVCIQGPTCPPTEVCPHSGTCAAGSIGARPTLATYHEGSGCGVGATVYQCTPTEEHHETGWSCTPLATLP
jgi:hypothetical protein